ncbi:hypothetical protein IQ269_25665 [Tychonema sp. LEGE 07199]|uniref:hypothetical protein n=1 Tax=unclassified Tychonema TaxID=2642144 RepID=UPI00187EC702|nr:MULTISPECIES: hypothetical protein [unclassified Tychonema]MBE9124095.1 hypothetical protein [Tychonema sp. LEGE 07199]MBE9135324.1 hypothetical protein [Tychonema sp. LEGE 07196]
MSNGLVVVSRYDIRKDELISFLRTVDAHIVEKPGNPFFAYLVREELYIWIALGNNNELEPSELKATTEKLVGEPKTFIVLEISKAEGSRRFAYELAAKLAAKWPCITDNMNGYNRQILSSQELFDLLEKGCNFEEY